MVVSVAKATSAEYYTSGAAGTAGAESYYLDAVTAGEPAGRWSGSGAELLGLAGEVQPEAMHTLYSDFVNPMTGMPVGRGPDQHKSVQERLDAALAREPGALPERVAELRAAIERTDRQSVIGWDATFSVPKSVTVAHTAAHRAELAAVRSGDLDRAAEFGAIRSGIESAIESANSAMLAYAESISTSRTGGGAGAPLAWVAAPGLTVASFFQHTSRNIDPQLHVHNVILNRAVCADGKARSLDGADLLAQKHALGAVADRALEEALTAQGFQFALRPDGQARELTVVPEDLADLFSSRSRQIGSRVADLAAAAEERIGRELTDLELYRLKQQATLATRAAKGAHVPETTEEMLERWWASTVGVGMDLDQAADRIREHLSPAAVAERAAAAGDGAWSPAAVISESVAAVGAQRSTWRRSDLMLEISRRLPSLGGLSPKDATEVLERLADQALTGDLVRQVSGTATGEVDELEGPLRGAAEAVAADPFTRPAARLYASLDTLAGEEALRRAAIETGGRALAAEQVEAWLTDHAPTIGVDQRAAVLGLATSPARLSVLVGPAGTGKSYAAGTLAALWADLTPASGEHRGQVIGLAVSQIATQVLRDDGIDAARNITAWLGIQDRLAAGSRHEADQTWRLSSDDVVMVDEASMVATADLERIHALVEKAGARMVLTGDPRQLGAVEAGGVMELLDGHAETYTLAAVRRFATEWEPAASLALRDGQVDALAVYDRHGRLNAHEDLEAAHEAAARAAVADRLDGRSVVVVTGSNADAAAIATRVRDQLAALGVVDAVGPSVLLGRDGCTASTGDLIAARRNDHALGVTNRAQYRVLEVGQDGSLTVAPHERDSRDTGPSVDTHASTPGTPPGTVRLPAGYVAEDVQLGYASTAHGAQGVTVDAAHLVTDGTLDAAGLYVGLSRGRLRNTAHVATTPAAGNRPDLLEQFRDGTTRPSARSVLEGCLERESTSRAATVEAELDADRLASVDRIVGRLENVVRAACRERLDRHLDHLVADGVLDPNTRERLGVEQGTEHLSRLLRAVEQAGADPHQTLTEAITRGRGLGDAESVSQVLSHRVTGGRPVPMPATTDTHDGQAENRAEQAHDGGDQAHGAGDRGRAPADISPQAAEHLEHLEARLQQRRQVLGARTAEHPPAWALTALGPVPADANARAEWERRAGIVAAHREAERIEAPEQAIGVMPGLSNTEKRASHAAAWEALGRPEAALDVTAMSEGQLRVWIRAGEQARSWAPAHADAALRAAEHAREEARQAAALARAEADHARRLGDLERSALRLERAAEHERTAALKDAASEQLSLTARARREWAAVTAPTFEAERRALEEARRRGLDLATEPDRTTTADLLAHERAARQAEDTHRTITEADLTQEHTPVEDGDGPDTPAVTWPAREDEADRIEWTGANGAAEATAGVDRATAAHEVLPEDIGPQELEIRALKAASVLARANDEASQNQAHTSEADRDDTERLERRRRDTGAELDDARARSREDSDVLGATSA